MVEKTQPCTWSTPGWENQVQIVAPPDLFQKFVIEKTVRQRNNLKGSYMVVF